MRKYLGSLMLLIYLFSLSGIKVQFHYCESQVAHWAFLSINDNASNPDCCESSKLTIDSSNSSNEECNMEDCCEDQFVFIDGEKDYVHPSFSLSNDFQWTSAIIPASPWFSVPNYYLLEVLVNVKNTGPPLDFYISTPPYIRYQKLIFYA